MSEYDDYSEFTARGLLPNRAGQQALRVIKLEERLQSTRQQLKDAVEGLNNTKHALADVIGDIKWQNDSQKGMVHFAIHDAEEILAGIDQ